VGPATVPKAGVPARWCRFHRHTACHVSPPHKSSFTRR